MSRWEKTFWINPYVRSYKHGAQARDLEMSDASSNVKGAARLKGHGSKMPERPLRLSNVLQPLRMIFWKDTVLTLWIAGSPYAVWYCVQASIPQIYRNVYHFNEVQIGLSYLTGGFGVVLGGYLNGMLMDLNYKATAEAIGHKIDKVSADDLTRFPIEKARTRGFWYIFLVYNATLVGYGWSIVRQAHVSVPLILQFTLAAICTAFQQTFNALLVDIFPESPSTATASGSVTRCLVSAVGVAVLQPLVSAVGYGWCFTTLSVLSGGGGAIAHWALRQWGMLWRSQCLHTK